MPPHVIGDLTRPRWRIDRYRHTARKQHAEEAEEIGGSSREHDRDRLTDTQVHLLETCSNLLRTNPQIAVGEDLPFTRIAVESDMRAVRVSLDVPVQHSCQSIEFSRCDRPFRRYGRPHDRRHMRPRFAADAGQCPQQIPRSLHRADDLLRQGNVKCALNPGDEFDTGEAVQAKIPVDHRVQRRIGGLVRMQFAHEEVDDFEQPGRRRIVATSDCVSCGRLAAHGHQPQRTGRIVFEMGRLSLIWHSGR